MERILGVGGVFFKARDPQALAAWYERHLGLPIEAGQTHGMLTAAAPGEATVWSAFPDDTPYFGTGPSPFMLNTACATWTPCWPTPARRGARGAGRGFRLRALRWTYDPEGNRFELWEPRPVRPSD